MAEARPPEPEKKPKAKSRVPVTLVIVLGVTVVEAAGFFVASKLLGGGPAVAYGEGETQGHVLEGEEPSPAANSAEIPLLSKFQVPNDKRGRLYVYDFDVVLKVPGHRAEEATKLVGERQGEIADRVACIVRAADPAVLHEPELKTLRLQLQHAIGEVVHDQDMILEVLIPRCVPIRSD